MSIAVEDIVNQSLDAIGYARKVGSIYEGSPQSRAALEIYQQTRDELLDAGPWPFARRTNVALTLLKGPPPAGGYNPGTPWTPVFPPPGFLYEYAYPADMLDLRAVYPAPAAMPVLFPEPMVWRIDNDNSLVDRNNAPTTQQKVILTNTAGAMASYIAQVTDPDLWEPGFLRSFIERLAAKLQPKLMPQMAHEKLLAEAAADNAIAERARG